VSTAPRQIITDRKRNAEFVSPMHDLLLAGMQLQAPTKCELVINLKTAKELGLTIPSAVLARGDAVIE
jgi:hypothetical protein